MTNHSCLSSKKMISSPFEQKTHQQNKQSWIIRIWRYTNFKSNNKFPTQNNKHRSLTYFTIRKKSLSLSFLSKSKATSMIREEKLTNCNNIGQRNRQVMPRPTLLPSVSLMACSSSSWTYSHVMFCRGLVRRIRASVWSFVTNLKKKEFVDSRFFRNDFCRISLGFFSLGCSCLLFICR